MINSELLVAFFVVIIACVIICMLVACITLGLNKSGYDYMRIPSFLRRMTTVGWNLGTSYLWMAIYFLILLITLNKSKELALNLSLFYSLPAIGMLYLHPPAKTKVPSKDKK